MTTLFAVTSLTELAALLAAVFGAFGVILVGFYKYAEARERDFEKSRQVQTDSFNKALENLGQMIELDSRVGQELVKESKETRKLHAKGYAEAEARNGHLAEITVQSRDQVIDAIQKVKRQNVKEQTVEHQHVEKQD